MFFFVGAILLASPGCYELELRPAVSLAELPASGNGGDAPGFTERTVVSYNLQRVLDAELAAADRLGSLLVVQRMDPEVRSSGDALATVLDRVDDDERVRLAVLKVLARADYSRLRAHAVRALAEVRDPQLRAALLDWLTRHPRIEVLDEVVRAWAAAEAPSADLENRYRRLVENLSNQTWPDALLAGLNAEGFEARGSALELLTARLAPDELRRRLLAVEAATLATEALQWYLNRLDYIPRRGRDLLPAVVLFKTRRETLAGPAARMAELWAPAGYRFDIRDFHLLAALHADKDRGLPTWSEMIERLAAEIAGRRHPEGLGPAGADGAAEELAHLSHADLVRTLLLSEMLAREGFRRRLAVFAEGDRQDRSSRWGGLVVYADRGAQCRLYPPGEGRGDGSYLPGEAMRRGAMDCLAGFVGHFSNDSDAPQVRPDASDERLAAGLNATLAIFTGVDAHTFHAGLLMPDGHHLSLGNFPFVSTRPD